MRSGRSCIILLQLVVVCLLAACGGNPGKSSRSEKLARGDSAAYAHGDSGNLLAYANDLYARGRYADALGYYFEFQQAGLLARQEQGFEREDFCEANLRLADMYFRGRGTVKDPHLGYYFWQRGLEVADGAQWGSCYRDNFVYGNRYHQESERMQLAERSIAGLGVFEQRELDRALALPPEQALAAVSAVSGRATRRPAAAAHSPQPRRGTGGNRPGWRPWAALQADICSAQAPSATMPWADVFELRATAIWSLKSTGQGAVSRGSAVAVAPRKLATNCHLIYDPNQVELYQGGLRMRARVSAADVDGDRCLLSVDQSMPSYVRSSRPFGYLRIGEEVAAIGNPRGLDTSLSRGIVAQKRTNTGLALIQTDAALSTGSSGGGLFDHAGNLAGITTFKVREGENLNFAIAVDEFCR